MNSFRIEIKDPGLIEKLKSCVAGKTETIPIKVHITQRREAMEHKGEGAEPWSPKAEALREKKKPTEPSLTLEGTVEGIGDYSAPKKAKTKAKEEMDEKPKVSAGAKALMANLAY